MASSMSSSWSYRANNHVRRGGHGLRHGSRRVGGVVIGRAGSGRRVVFLGQPFAGDSHQLVYRDRRGLRGVAMLAIVGDIVHEMLDFALVLQHDGLRVCRCDGVRVDELAVFGLEAHALGSL